MIFYAITQHGNSVTLEYAHKKKPTKEDVVRMARLLAKSAEELFFEAGKMDGPELHEISR
jgi:hypothetical protein